MDPLEDYPDYAGGYAYQDRYVRDIDSIDSVGPRRSNNDNTGFLLHSTISRDEADGSKTQNVSGQGHFLGPQRESSLSYIID